MKQPYISWKPHPAVFYPQCDPNILSRQGKESGVKMTETGGAVVCAVAQLFKGASGVAGLGRFFFFRPLQNLDRGLRYLEVQDT